MTFAPSLRPHTTLLESSVSSASKKAQEIVQVLTKNVRSTSANETLDGVRPIVRKMVAGEEYITGSKMRAYENVGRAIGKSPSWVRKLLGRHDVGLQHFEWLNIVAGYRNICARVENAAADERARAEHLRRLANAPPEGAAGVVARPTRSDRRSKAVYARGGPSEGRSGVTCRSEVGDANR